MKAAHRRLGELSPVDPAGGAGHVEVDERAVAVEGHVFRAEGHCVRSHAAAGGRPASHDFRALTAGRSRRRRGACEAENAVSPGAPRQLVAGGGLPSPPPPGRPRRPPRHFLRRVAARTARDCAAGPQAAQHLRAGLAQNGADQEVPDDRDDRDVTFDALTPAHLEGAVALSRAEGSAQGLVPVGGGIAMVRGGAPAAAREFQTFALAAQALG